MTRPADHVLIVANYAPDQQKSMLRFGAALAEHLDRLGLKVTVTRPAPIFHGLARGNPRLEKLAGYIDKFAIFPIALALRSRSFRVVHIVDHSNGLYIGCTGATKTLITCHDLFPLRILLGEFDGLSWGLNGRILQRLNLRGLIAARRMTAVSAATVADIARLVGGKAVVTMIPNALSETFLGEAKSGEIAASPSPAHEGAPYFLHVGGNAFYKNRCGVVRLFAALAGRARFRDHRLVLAGKAPDALLIQALAESPVRDRIDVTVDPDDTQVRMLYSDAEALLFISLHEGFGWPIIEAQSMGCPVVTSDREPMRAVAGGAAVLVDPEMIVEAADVIEAAAPRFPDLRQAGYANAHMYAPDSVYPRYIEIYRELTGSAVEPPVT